MYIHPMFLQLNILYVLGSVLSFGLGVAGLLFINQNFGWLPALLTAVVFVGVMALENITETAMGHFKQMEVDEDE